MSITPLRFTGISDFSADFQTIMDRAIRIAQLPIEVMLNQQADLISKKQSLGSLGSRIQGLANAVAALGGQGTSKGLVATSSNTSKVTVSITNAASPATYTLSDITSVARRAAESTATGLATSDATAVDADNIVELVFDGVSYEIDLTAYGNHLEGLHEAITDKIAEEGLGLTATLINSGHATAPHHLTLSATASGAKSLELWTEAGGMGTNLLTAVNQGAGAAFKINGVAVTQSGNLVTGIAAGLNLSIVDITDPGETVTIDLSSSRTPVETGLKNFVAAYNALVSDLNAQIGENAGLLTGDHLIGYTKGVLRQVLGYQNAGGTIRSLTDLGIEVNSSGVMSFKSETFHALSTSQFEAAFDFLGSETTGFGAMADRLDEISHPLLGDLIDSQIKQYDSSDARLQTQIDALAGRIELMQSTLFTQLQQADVLLASLEGQQRMLDASIQAINFSIYGRNNR